MTKMNDTNDMKQGIKRFLHKAKDSDSIVIVIFKYPDFIKTTRRSGKVIEIGDNYFVLDEVYEGQEIFGFDFVVEVKLKK